MEKIYIVKYGTGNYDEYEFIDVFATLDENIAKIWIGKFNLIKDKLKNHYQIQYEKLTSNIFQFTTDEQEAEYMGKCIHIGGIGRAFYEITELR